MTYQGTKLLGQAIARPAQMEGYVRRINPAAPDLVPIYRSLAPQLGIRADLAYAQAVHETDFFRYTGVVQPDQHNYGGIGATGPDNPGASFATPEEGVLAHLQHLYAYASTEPLPEGMELVDPRFDLVERGSATYVGDLTARWATDVQYGPKVDRHLGEMLMEPLPGEPYAITRAYMDTSSQNRPGRCVNYGCWEGVKGIVVHRTASSTADAWAIQRYFNDAPDGRHASSQFVLDDKVILLIMPVGEVAYHTAGKNLSYLGIETCENTWGTPEWPETYRKLVWLTAYLVRAFGLDITDVTGHFWWDPVNRPYDPTHMGWAPEEDGQATGLFEWNQFIADVQEQIETPPPVDIQIERRIQIACDDGVLIGSTTYVPIRPYTECLVPGASLRWDPSGPTVTVELPPTGSASGAGESGVSGVSAAGEDGGAAKTWWQRLWSR